MSRHLFRRGREEIFIDDAYFPRRAFESEPVWPIIPQPDSLFCQLSGKKSAVIGWFKFQVPFAPTWFKENGVAASLGRGDRLVDSAPGEWRDNQ